MSDNTEGLPSLVKDHARHYSTEDIVIEINQTKRKLLLQDNKSMDNEEFGFDLLDFKDNKSYYFDGSQYKEDQKQLTHFF